MAVIKSEKILSLLEKFSFEVPIYQRNYVWNKDECIELIKNIFEYVDLLNETNDGEKVQDNGYYIGSIIICNVPNDVDKQIIVDGQQRLTTIILFMHALKLFVKNKNNNVNLEIIEEKINKCIFDNDSVDKKTKLKINNLEDSQYLEKILRTENIDGFKKLDSQNIQDTIYYKNILELYTWISNHDDKHQNFDYIFKALKMALIAKIQIQHYDNPNKVFEVINTTGKKLEPCELIKNYIFFYCWNYSNSLNELSDKYKRIELNLGDQNKQNTFFRYFNVIFANENVGIIKAQKLEKKNSKNIYTQFKEEIFCENNGFNFDKKDSVINILEIIEKHSLIWKEIYNFKHKNEKDKYFYDVFFDSINTYYSLVHCLFLDYKNLHNNQLPYEEKVKIFKVITKFIFSILLSEKPEKEITRDVPYIFKNFRLSKESDFEKWFSDKHKNPSLKILNKDEVESKIKTSKIYKTNEKKTRLLLAGIEMYKTGFEKNINLSKDITIEHIMPQNLKYDDDTIDYIKFIQSSIGSHDIEKIKEFHLTHLDTLPNLTLLSRPKNSSIKNNDFKDKRHIFNEGTTLAINKVIAEYEGWSICEMNKRAKLLSDDLIKFLHIIY